jgi:DNA primase
LRGEGLQELIDEKAGKKEALTAREHISTIKYLIHARIEAKGVVERPDVVGAIFGQTEGLLGDELDLRELLKAGRIGRIRVDINSAHGKSFGTITIPSSLDRVETSIIAAALETIDRVGPCEATIKVEKIDDIRHTKRKFIINRAREILELIEKTAPETQEITEQVRESTRLNEITEYEGLPAGPRVRDADSIIIVEGRADVLNLLRADIKNVVGIEGTGIPQTIIDLSKNKITTAFLDSDRGGDLILKELLQVADIDFVARPPEGRSVEELTKKEVIKSLRARIPVEDALAELKGKPEETVKDEDIKLRKLGNMVNELRGTLEARLLNEELEPIEIVQVSDLKNRLSQLSGVKAIVFDGVVTQELAEIAAEKGVEYVVGICSRVEIVPENIEIVTVDELRKIGHKISFRSRTPSL